ncbi:hypothetical protein [Bradyrhizobium sp. CCBAU 51753]|uniref:hypothetical protein n=1 Tax=Bradyrhizobium sp. CCBAU 51753 TaxID=1325100 RepID=UPI0018BFC44B|nr:hypothetical protein [Bradyrhizobium sp. CCBAU 51753]QOZ24048.1 hypothetical protein XH93_10975 [Bradyrhizobium sp. CCBAU 51753]
MGEIVGFVSKSELERARLIREARAIYDSIFPPVDAAGERQDDRATEGRQTGGTGPLHRKETGG